MPFEADFELIDFEIERPDESSGDEPYLIAVYWALDGSIGLGPGGALTGTPQMVFRGGDHENIARRSLGPTDGAVPIPGAVGQASMRLMEFSAPIPATILPIAGITVVAMEEDNTPDAWANDIMSGIRTGIPSFAAEFIGGLTIASVLTPAAMTATIAEFQRRMRSEIKSIAGKAVARRIGRSLGFGIFAAADRDDEIGQSTIQATASTTRLVTARGQLGLGPNTVGGGLSGGGAGGDSVPARYLINTRIDIAHERPTNPPLFVDIDFFGRDDERGSDEFHNPPQSSFPIEPGRRVSRSFRWGGEVRVEYDFDLAYEASSGDAHLTVNGRLFEGSHELTNDLDGRGAMTVSARSRTRNRSTLVIESDERRSDDMGQLEVTLRNDVAP